MSFEANAPCLRRVSRRYAPEAVSDTFRLPSENSTDAPAPRRMVEAESTLSPILTATQDDPFFTSTLPSAQVTERGTALKVRTVTRTDKITMIRRFI